MPRGRRDSRLPTRDRRQAIRRAEGIEKAEAEMQVRALRQEQFFGCAEDDLPFLPGSTVRLTVGAIRPMAARNSVLGSDGLVGSLIARQSRYRVCYLDHGHIGEWLESRARVEFIASTETEVAGLRYKVEHGDEHWSFAVRLDCDRLELLRKFALAVDPEEVIWTDPRATVEIFADTLQPLPLGVHPWDVSFVGPVSALRIGDDIVIPSTIDRPKHDTDKA